MRPLSRSYLQHGRRHVRTGSDPMPGLGPAAVANLQFFGAPLTLSGDSEIAWTTFATTDQSIFGTNTLGAYSAPTNTTGDNTLILLDAGLYIATSQATWDDGTFPCAAFVDVIVGDADLTAHPGFTNTEALTTNVFAGTGGQIYPFSLQATFVNPGNQGALRMAVQNLDVSDHTVSDAVMSCYFWPCGDVSIQSVY